LQLLPPLKPDAESAANYTFESRSSPGYTAPDIRRVRSNTTSRHELGRQYNPLQILRNRRLRTREKRPLTVLSESFADTQRVATWLDDVEGAAQRPDYRTGADVVQLPDFLQRTDEVNGELEAGKGHRRTGTTSTVVTRPEIEWTVDPTERLADAYWTEQDDNKTLIENKGRHTIFPSRVKSATKDSRKSEDLSRNEPNNAPMEVMDEETEQGKAPRKHRHLLSLHKADRIRLNRLSRQGRSASVSSGSEGEGRQPRSSARGNGDIESVAPLNKHMDALIAKDQRGNVSSPDLDSPDHWDLFRLVVNNAAPSTEPMVRFLLQTKSLHNDQRVRTADSRNLQRMIGLGFLSIPLPRIRQLQQNLCLLSLWIFRLHASKQYH
jgi:hypothetical protein